MLLQSYLFLQFAYLLKIFWNQLFLYLFEKLHEFLIALMNILFKQQQKAILTSMVLFKM